MYLGLYCLSNDTTNIVIFGSNLTEKLRVTIEHGTCGWSIPHGLTPYNLPLDSNNRKLNLQFIGKKTADSSLEKKIYPVWSLQWMNLNVFRQYTPRHDPPHPLWANGRYQAGLGWHPPNVHLTFKSIMQRLEGPAFLMLMVSDTSMLRGSWCFKMYLWGRNLTLGFSISLYIEG